MARVWIISPYASPEAYGFNSRPYVVGKELVNRGHLVTVFSFTGSHYLRLQNPMQTTDELVNDHEGVGFHWFRSFNRWVSWPPVRIINWILFNLQFRKWLRSYVGEAPNSIIISSPTLNQAFLIPVLKKRFSNAKVIFEVRDIWPLSLMEIGSYSNYNLIIQWLRSAERIAYEKADQVVAVMPGFAQYLKDHKADVVIRKTTYLPHCQPIQEIKKKEIPDFDIGYAGSLGRANDLKTLMESLKILKQNNIQPSVLIFGDGVDSKEIRRLALELPKVVLKKWTHRQALLPELANCRFFYDGFLALPMYKYGFSRNKWIDYFMLKKPILASYSGFWGDLPISECGWQCDAQNPQALAETIGNILHLSDNEITQKGENGFQFLVSKRNSKDIIDQYEKILFQ